MAVTLTPIETFKIGIIGLGNEGSEIVSRLDLKTSIEVDRVVCDCCRNSLQRLEESTASQMLVGTSLVHGMSCVGQIELGRSIFLNDQEVFQQWVAEKDLVIAVGALGGGFAGGLLPELAKLAVQQSTSLLAYTLLPFSFEGRKRVEDSKQILSGLRESCMAVASFEGDDYLSFFDDDGFAQPAVHSAREDIAGAISNMVMMLSENGLYEFDLATLNASFDLDVAKTMVISSNVGDESCDTPAAIEMLLEKVDEKLPDRQFRVDRLLISVVAGRQLPANAVNQINSVIADRFKEAGKTYFGACISPDMEGLRIVIYLSVHLGKQFEWMDLSSGEKDRPVVHSKRKKNSNKATASSRKSSKKSGARSKDDSQGLLDSILTESNRHYFDDTPSNSWNGIDLDVPTYIRRGIRISK